VSRRPPNTSALHLFDPTRACLSLPHIDRRRALTAVSDPFLFRVLGRGGSSDLLSSFCATFALLIPPGSLGAPSSAVERISYRPNCTSSLLILLPSPPNSHFSNSSTSPPPFSPPVRLVSCSSPPLPVFFSRSSAVPIVYWSLNRRPSLLPVPLRRLRFPLLSPTIFLRLGSWSGPPDLFSLR